MAILMVPPIVLQAQNIEWEPLANLVAGGKSLSGFMQRGRIDGGSGYWRAVFADIMRRTRDDHAQWSALKALADGGVRTMVVPCCEPMLTPWPRINGQAVTSAAVSFDDGVSFDDDSLWDDLVIQAKAGAAAAGATSLNLTVTASGQFRGGEMFTIDHPTVGPRLYEIASINAATGNVLSGTSGYLAGTLAVTIRPSLWAAIGANTTVDFDKPRCTMVLQDPGSLSGETRLRRFGNGSVTFIESPGV